MRNRPMPTGNSLAFEVCGMKQAKARELNAHAFLTVTGAARRIMEYDKNDLIFAQGDNSSHVLYIQQGVVKLSVVNGVGREAVVAMLGPKDFFGEGCLVGQKVRIATATALAAATVISITKEEMARVLHGDEAFSDRFIKHMVSRNIRAEADLVDQLFNSTEKRLARTLLLLARYGTQDTPETVLPKISQETLAAMIGTTRSRVNLFMNKFKKLGFINQDDGSFNINSSLLSVVLRE
jgi:CRP-like cAMP-binding protein